MKKILLIMLLTFTAITYADEGQYTMLSSDYGIYVLNTENSEVKYCLLSNKTGKDSEVLCTDWSGNNPVGIRND